MFDTEKFISCIQNNRAIWEVGALVYNDKGLKHKSWYNVGEGMYAYWFDLAESEKEEQVKEMKKKWRHIRDSYIKFLNQTKNGPAGRKRKYMYADKLGFLQRTMRNKSSSNTSIVEEWQDLSGDGHEVIEEIDNQDENFQTRNEPYNISSVEVFLTEGNIKQEKELSNYSTETETLNIIQKDESSPNAKRSKTQHTSETVQHMPSLNGISNRRDSDNECDIFGRYVAVQLKKMSPEQSILAQEQMQAILTRCRLNDIRNPLL